MTTINNLTTGTINGVLATTFNYLSNITSDVQTQLNNINNLTNITSNIQTQINNIQTQINNINNLRVTGTTICYISHQYDVLFNYESIPDGIFDVDIVNMITGKLTSFKLVKYINLPATISNIFTESGLSIYAFSSTGIGCTNSQNSDVTLKWGILKKN
jgi:hypothetical protein